MLRVQLLFVSVLPLAALACSNGTEGLDATSGNPDAATNPDAAVVPDGGTEQPDAAAPDAGPAVRRLIEVKLFGDMPLDNAVLDPQFDPSSQSWLGIGDLMNGGRFVRTSFRELAQTPSQLGASLWVPARATDPTDTVVLGSVMASAPPLEASIWIGRDEGDASIVGSAAPSLVMTLASTGDEQSFDLTPDPASPPVTLDGRVWQKYSATIMEASIGIITFAIQDPVHKPLYLNTPRVLSRHTLRASSAVVRPRGLTPRESKAVGAMASWRRRRLGDGRKIEPEVEHEALRRALRPGQR